MIKANVVIQAGGRTYQRGQTVTGLSELDKKWMKAAGYVTETAGRKEKPSDAQAEKEETADEF